LQNAITTGKEEMMEPFADGMDVSLDRRSEQVHEPVAGRC
jgi:hypothetical protein